MKNSEPLNTCHQDLQINGYLPDIDAEEAAMSEAADLSHDSYDYYQELFVSGSVSIQQPLELLVNAITNSFLPSIKVRCCSGRASTSTGRTATNNNRTSSLGTAPIRTKPSAPGSVAGRASLSTEEKQAKKSGVGFFHRTNDRFYSRNGGFESSSGSDDTSSSTTDDEGLQQADEKNRSQSTKRIQPISSSLNKVPQGRRNTVRNGSLPNRLSQTSSTTSRTSSVNSINRITTKKSTTSTNQTIIQSKQRSSSTISIQRKMGSFNNSIQKTTALRSSSANPGTSKTSGMSSIQKALNVEKAQLPSSSFQHRPVTPEDERQKRLEDAAEVLRHHAFHSDELLPSSNQQLNINSIQATSILNSNSCLTQTFFEPSTVTQPVNQQHHHHIQSQNDIIMQQQQNFQHPHSSRNVHQQLYESPPHPISQPTSHDNQVYLPQQQHQQQQLSTRTPPNLQQILSPNQHFSQMGPQSFVNMPNSMPPTIQSLPYSAAVPSQSYSHYNSFNYQSPPAEYFSTQFSGVPQDLSQHNSPIVSNSINQTSPQTYEQQSPYQPLQRPIQRRSNPSASMQMQQQHYSSPTDTVQYINSPITPMSNPHPSPLPIPPPPYPINNGPVTYTSGGWEQPQQQFMMQQIPWHHGQQFRSPQHPPINLLQPGPGMYSVPPDCYGYPAPTGIPTMPETPSKTSKTPAKKKKTPPKESTLNRLLSTPVRIPIVQQQQILQQQQIPSMRPQVMPQHLSQSNPRQLYPQEGIISLQHQRMQTVHPRLNMQQHQSQSSNMQPQIRQYYMVPANGHPNMQILSHPQQIQLRPHQSFQQVVQPQHQQQYTHQSSMPQQVQFHQLSLASPQQLQQPMSQPDQMETYITSPLQQQPPHRMLQQSNQRPASLPHHHMQQQNPQHIHQQRYTNFGSESISNNPVVPQINSPYSNGPMPLPSTPVLSNPMSANFYPQNEVPINASPEKFQYSPNNPQLPNRLSNFNNTLLYNPNSSISPYTSPLATATPSPPKTPQGKRGYIRKATNNDETGEIAKRMKESSSLQSPVVRVTTTEQPRPSTSYTVDHRIIRTTTSAIQVHSQSSGTYVSSSMNKSSQNLSYTSAFNQQTNPQLKVVFGLQEHSSPFAEANNFYNCPTFDTTRSKEPIVEDASKNQASVSSQNLSHHSSDMTDQSNPTSSSNSIMPVSTEQIIYSLQSEELDEIDPCEEFLDPEVIHGISHSFSILETSEASKEHEHEGNVEEVIESKMHVENNSELTEASEHKDSTQNEEPEQEIEKEFEYSAQIVKEVEDSESTGNVEARTEKVDDVGENTQMSSIFEKDVISSDEQNNTTEIEEPQVVKEIDSSLTEHSEVEEHEADGNAETTVEKDFTADTTEENNSQMTQVYDEPEIPADHHKDAPQIEEPEDEKETEASASLSLTTEVEQTEAERNVADINEKRNSQMAEIIEEATIPHDEQLDVTQTEEPEAEEKTESTSRFSNATEIEEGEIIDSDESIKTEDDEILDSEFDKRNYRKRSRSVESDKNPVVEEKRLKLSTESPSVSPKSVEDNGLHQEFERIDIIDEESLAAKVPSKDDANLMQPVNETIEEPKLQQPEIIDEELLLADSPTQDSPAGCSNHNSEELNETEVCVNEEKEDNLPESSSLEAADEVSLIANSPVVNSPITTVTQNVNEVDNVGHGSLDVTENEWNSKDSENDQSIDEEFLLADTPPIEEPMEVSENPAEEIIILNTSENHVDEMMNEVVMDVEMLELTDDNDEDTPPSYEELLKHCGEDLSIGNNESLSKFGANAAMDAATTICTLNIIRNEVYQIISDLSSSTSVEQSIMINLINETVDSELAKVKDKYLAIIKVIDKTLETSTTKFGMGSGNRFEGAIYEVLIPLYTAAVKWEKQENKNPEFYLNIKYVKKLLLSMVANFGSNDSTNIWHELFTLQIFTTPERLNIFYQLLMKSINICTFLDEYFSLINDLFNVTQLAAALFIKDYKEFKKRDPMLAKVIAAAVKHVRELSPELRSRIIFQFQVRLYKFLHKFENSNILPEAYSFVSTLSWDVKTFGNSRDLPTGYLPILQKIHPTVDKIFKETLKELHKSGTIEIKGWIYNLSKSILQSNFMATIVRNTNTLEKEVQEALFAVIIPSLLKLVLSVPHLFVAADPYHSLELVPSIFEDALPILNKAAEDIHDQMPVPFMPFATIMGAIKDHESQSTNSLLKTCQNLYLTLKNAPSNIPEAIQAERRRCSNKTLYEKIHREYVRRQMAKSDIEKYEMDANKLDLKHLHLLISKLFSTKTLEIPPRIIAGIKEGDKEAVSTEKIFRARMISKCCGIFKEVLDSVPIRQKLEFMIDHPLLNEKQKIDDILNVHQFGEDMLGCFTAFIGLLSLPNNKILGDPKSSTFFNSIKERRNAIYYYAIKNSALIKNNKPPIPIQILKKDNPIYEILVQIFVTAEMKRILCCPDNVSSYLYLALIINDIPGISIADVSQQLFDACGISDKKVEFFATANFSKDLETKIETIMNKRLEKLVKNISSRVNTTGIPRISHHQLSGCQTRINQLKCLIIEIMATFWNPHKLLLGVGLTLECRSKIQYAIKELGKLLLTGFNHMGKTTVTVENLKDMILDEMGHIRGESFMNFENSSLYGFVLYIQKIFKIKSIFSSILIILYMSTITNQKQLYAERLKLAQRISRETTLLKIFGLKNSELSPIGIINARNQLMHLEKIFEADYVFHASESDPEIFYIFLDHPFKEQYKELLSALEGDCREIKQRFPFHVNNQRNLYHPNTICHQSTNRFGQSPDTPLINIIPKNINIERSSKEVPENFHYFSRC
uniref:Uncharacterized protein n=1 Tax=Panagrolaimus sp. ES5 TaxID=591445 RepID=A0AC34GTD9_9BILA